MTYALLQAKKTAELRAELGKPVRVTLPWPPKELSPNARVYWREKNQAVGQYKTACWAILTQHRIKLKGKTKFKITFCEPDRRARDTDNLIGSFKAGQDALSLVTIVNDRLFEITYARGEPIKGGAVEIEVLA